MFPSGSAPRSEPDFAAADAETIAQLAETHGWQTAAHDHMRLLNPSAYRFAVDEYRGHFRFLLPLTSSSVVLQIRCGWGAAACHLSTYAGRVVTLDDRPTRLRFASARRRHVSAATLNLVHGVPGSDLPFGSGVFDAVVLMDAFDGPGQSRNARRNDVQQAILKEVRRVLRPQGWLLLAVANRLGFATPPLEGRNNLRTYWGYRSVLRAAGFSQPGFYAALPSHQEPFFILPLNNRRLVNHFIDGLFAADTYRSELEARGLGRTYQVARSLWRVGRLFRVTTLARYVAPAYFVLAQGSRDGDTSHS